MGAAYSVSPGSLTRNRVYDISFETDDASSLQSFQYDVTGNPIIGIDDQHAGNPAHRFPMSASTLPIEAHPAVLHIADGDATPLADSFALQLIQDRADIDISGPEFNFVRSIRVFDARMVRQSEGREDCNRSQSVRMGSYGTQGDFQWTHSSVSALPEAHVGTEGYGSNCPSIWHRSVFVEWRDYEGNYGYEQVNY